MRRMIRLVGLVSACLLLAIPAMADALDDAKAAGKLGEGPDGYLHVVDPSDAGAAKLADDINAKRKEKYQEIATQQQITLDQVSVLAGRKLIERAPAGEYVMDAQGRWSRK